MCPHPGNRTGQAHSPAHTSRQASAVRPHRATGSLATGETSRLRNERARPEEPARARGRARWDVGGGAPGGLGASDGLHQGGGGELGVPGRGLEAGLEFLARVGSARVHGPFPSERPPVRRREPSTADPPACLTAPGASAASADPESRTLLDRVPPTRPGEPRTGPEGPRSALPPGSPCPPDSPCRGQPPPLPASATRPRPLPVPPGRPRPLPPPRLLGTATALPAFPGDCPRPHPLPVPPREKPGPPFLGSPSPVTAGLFNCSPGLAPVRRGESAVALPRRISQSSAADRGQRCERPSERVRPLNAPEAVQAWPGQGHAGFPLPVPSSPKPCGQAAGTRISVISGWPENGLRCASGGAPGRLPASGA